MTVDSYVLNSSLNKGMSEDSMPPMPIDIVNAFLTIASSMELIMAEAVQAQGLKRMNMASISNQFFRRCGIPANDWTFCDSLFLRYFAKFSKAVHVGKVFSSHATCFLACICLMNRQELVQLVTDVYSDGPQFLISYESFRMLLHNVLDTKTGGNCEIVVSEQFNKFLNYVSTNPLLYGREEFNDEDNEENNRIFPIVNIPGDENFHEDASGLTLEEVLHYGGPHSVSTQVVAAYCAKKSPSSLWPLIMLQAQLRKIFMGEDFWIRWQQNEFFQYLREKKVTSDVFWCAQVLFQIYIETSAAMNTLANNARADNSNSNNNPQYASTPSSTINNNNNTSGSGGNAPLAASTPFQLGSGLRVLIIEDSKAQRKIMMKRLQLASGSLGNNKKVEKSWVMGSAGSGEEALTLIETETEQFDIVIVDENLGGSGGELMGHEVVKIMRENLKMVDTVIIGCTSNTKRHTQSLLGAGADAVWPKPMPDDADILRDVAHFLSRRHESKAAAEDTSYPRELPNKDKDKVVVNKQDRIHANQGGRIKQILLGR